MPISPEPAATLIYAAHDVADLPACYRALLDPAQPMPDDVRYIQRCYLSNIVVSGFLAIPAVFALIMTVVDAYRGKLILKEWLALFPIFTLPLVWSLWQGRRDKRLGEAIAAGRLRLGLFLTPTALLLRMTPDICTMIPRQFISHFELAVLDAGTAASPSSYSVVVCYRLKKGERVTLRRLKFACPELAGYFLEHQALLLLLQQWLGGSEPAITPPKRRPGPRTPDEIAQQRRTAQLAEEAQGPQREAARATRTPRNGVIAMDGNGDLKTRWERDGDDGVNYFCHLSRRGEVVAYEFVPGLSASEMGGSVSFAEFVAGEYQGLLGRQFGMAVLDEILATVVYLQAHPHLLTILKDG